MCAIYTAVPPPSREQLIALAKQNEAQSYGARRCTLGRKAVAELVAHVAPPSHTRLAATILERDLWGFLTPAASRGNHAATLGRAHPDLVVPFPLWPPCVELATLTGATPAEYIGNNLALLPRPLVDAAVEVFEEHEAASEVAAYLNDFLRKAHARRDAVLLHWDHR